MRLLAGVLAGQNFESTLIGDSSLSKRPMDRIINPLRKMNVNIHGVDNKYPPISICPSKELYGIEYTSTYGKCTSKVCNSISLSLR